jgi:nucleoside-diphosphate-sugar epimerase
MRIFITGASGFVGAPLGEALLRAGHELAALGFDRTGETPAGATMVPGDLRDPSSYGDALARFAPELLVHAAWYLDPRDYTRSPSNLDLLDGSARLIARALAAGCKRVLVCGTCSEYAASDAPLDEDAPLHGLSLYAATKIALYHVAREQTRAAGASFVWPRLFNLYGPREASARLVPAVIGALLAGDRARVSAGLQVRDYLHVHDAADALAMIALGDVQGAINVGSGVGITVRSLVECIGELTGGSDRIDFGAIATRPDETPKVVADVARLRWLGFAPRHGLRNGLQQVIDAMRSH